MAYATMWSGVKTGRKGVRKMDWVVTVIYDERSSGLGDKLICVSDWDRDGWE